MKKLLIQVMFVFALLCSQNAFAGRGGNAFAGGFVGGTFGGLLGSAMTSNARSSSGGDDSVSRRAIRKVYEEIDDLKLAVKKDLEGLSSRIEELHEMFEELRTQINKSSSGDSVNNKSEEAKESIKSKKNIKRKKLHKKRKKRFNVK